MKAGQIQKLPTAEVFAGADSALRRAQKRARETAARTGTPLVIYKDGKIEKRRVTRGRKAKSA